MDPLNQLCPGYRWLCVFCSVYCAGPDSFQLKYTLLRVDSTVVLPVLQLWAFDGG